jgi:hypothetical protein
MACHLLFVLLINLQDLLLQTDLGQYLLDLLLCTDRSCSLRYPQEVLLAVELYQQHFTQKNEYLDQFG